jgi:isopenicillin N synthase-like dioxygenase
MAMGLGLEENFFVEKYISDPFWVIRIIGTPRALASLPRHALADRVAAQVILHSLLRRAILK